MSGPPQVWFPSGTWAGVKYPWPVQPVIIVEPEVVPAPVDRRKDRERTTQSAGMQLDAFGAATATAVVQFPAAAEVWVAGKKVRGDALAADQSASLFSAISAGGNEADGNAMAEWTLTSPALKPGEAHTFEVKGRWRAGGKTFEATRRVTVTAGDRNRTIVVAGTEVR